MNDVMLANLALGIVLLIIGLGGTLAFIFQFFDSFLETKELMHTRNESHSRLEIHSNLTAVRLLWISRRECDSLRVCISSFVSRNESKNWKMKASVPPRPIISNTIPSARLASMTSFITL